jgi:hypothetical protein
MSEARIEVTIDGIKMINDLGDMVWQMEYPLHDKNKLNGEFPPACDLEESALKRGYVRGYAHGESGMRPEINE